MKNTNHRTQGYIGDRCMKVALKIRGFLQESNKSVNRFVKCSAKHASQKSEMKQRIGIKAYFCPLRPKSCTAPASYRFYYECVFGGNS